MFLLVFLLLMVIGSFCCLFVCSFIVSCWICVGSSLLLLALPRLSTLAIWGLQSFSDHGEARSLYGFPLIVGAARTSLRFRSSTEFFLGIANQRSNGFETFSHGNFWRSKFRMKSKGSSIVGYSRHSRCRLWQFPVHQSSMISCAFGTHGYGCRIWSGFVSFAFHCFGRHEQKHGLETLATSANLYDLCLTNILILPRNHGNCLVVVR